MPASLSAGSDTLTLPIDEIPQARQPLDHGNEQERQKKRDHRYGGERRREAELEEAEDLDRDGHLPRPHQEEREVDIGERMHKGEYRARDNAALDEREYHVPERAPARSAEARGRELEVGRERVQADRDGAHRERQADDDVADEQRSEADVLAQAGVLEELQQAHAGHERRQHERSERERHERFAAAKAMAREREREREREQRTD